MDGLLKNTPSWLVWGDNMNDNDSSSTSLRKQDRLSLYKQVFSILIITFFLLGSIPTQFAFAQNQEVAQDTLPLADLQTQEALQAAAELLPPQEPSSDDSPLIEEQQTSQPTLEKHEASQRLLTQDERIKIQDINNNLSITLNQPINNDNLTEDEFNFTLTNLTTTVNCSFIGNWSGVMQQEPIGMGPSSNLNQNSSYQVFPLTLEGNATPGTIYAWNIFCMDATNASDNTTAEQSETFTFQDPYGEETIIITLIGPENNANATGMENLSFNLSAEVFENYTCKTILNESVKNTTYNVSGNNTTVDIQIGLLNITQGQYEWYVNCSDAQFPEDWNTSETRNFTFQAQGITPFSNVNITNVAGINQTKELQVNFTATTSNGSLVEVGFDIYETVNNHTVYGDAIRNDSFGIASSYNFSGTWNGNVLTYNAKNTAYFKGQNPDLAEVEGFVNDHETTLRYNISTGEPVLHSAYNETDPMINASTANTWNFTPTTFILNGEDVNLTDAAGIVGTANVSYHRDNSTTYKITLFFENNESEEPVEELRDDTLTVQGEEQGPGPGPMYDLSFINTGPIQRSANISETITYTINITNNGNDTMYNFSLQPASTDNFSWSLSHEQDTITSNGTLAMTLNASANSQGEYYFNLTAVVADNDSITFTSFDDFSNEFLLNVTAAEQEGQSVENLTSCPGENINSNTTYVLLNDFDNESVWRNNFSQKCFELWQSQENVIIDCQGNSIIGNGSSQAIYVVNSPSNFTVKNCVIENVTNAIYFGGSMDNIIIENNTVSNYVGYDPNTFSDGAIHLKGANSSLITSNDVDMDFENISGIVILDGYHNIVEYNNITNLNNYSMAGIFLGNADAPLENTTARYNTFTNVSTGLRLNNASNSTIYSNNFVDANGKDVITSDDSTGNTFYLNNFTSNTSVEDNSMGNSWNNSATGNHWLEYDSVDDYGEGDTCVDANNNSFCDAAYPLDGSAGSIDYLPITYDDGSEESNHTWFTNINNSNLENISGQNELVVNFTATAQAGGLEEASLIIFRDDSNSSAFEYVDEFGGNVPPTSNMSARWNGEVLFHNESTAYPYESSFGGEGWRQITLNGYIQDDEFDIYFNFTDTNDSAYILYGHNYSGQEENLSAANLTSLSFRVEGTAINGSSFNYSAVTVGDLDLDMYTDEGTSYTLALSASDNQSNEQFEIYGAYGSVTVLDQEQEGPGPSGSFEDGFDQWMSSIVSPYIIKGTPKLINFSLARMAENSCLDSVSITIPTNYTYLGHNTSSLDPSNYTVSASADNVTITWNATGAGIMCNQETYYLGLQLNSTDNFGAEDFFVVGTQNGTEYNLTKSVYTVTTFSYSGQVFDTQGQPIGNATAALSIRSFGQDGDTDLGSFTAESNASGHFNITGVPGLNASISNETPMGPSGSMEDLFYQLSVTKYNDSNNQYGMYVGPSMPDLPETEIRSERGLANPLIYLKDAVTFHVQVEGYDYKAGPVNQELCDENGCPNEAFNWTNVSFSYGLKDALLGYPIAEDYSSWDTEAYVSAPLNRDYSFMVFPESSFPLYVSFENISDSENCNETGVNISTTGVEATCTIQNGTYLIDAVITADMNLTTFTGNVNKTDLDAFFILPYNLGAGNMIFEHDILPQNLGNMMRWPANESFNDQYNLTTGEFNITLPATQTHSDILLVAYVAKNETYYRDSYILGTQSLQLDVEEYNFTLEELINGENYSISSNDVSQDWNESVVINTTAIEFNFVYNGSKLTSESSFVELRIEQDGTDFLYMIDASSGEFNLPLEQGQSIDKLNIYSKSYAPLSSPVSASILNGSTATSKFNCSDGECNISFTRFDTFDPETGDSLSNVFIDFYTSSQACDVPNPDISCQLMNGSDKGEFSPLKAILLGDLSLRISMGNISVHYANTDLLASGPPDAAFSSNATGGDFDAAWKFGSQGPEIYDDILLSMPYSQSIGLDTINISIPVLYDDDFNVFWNISVHNTTSLIGTDYEDFLNTSYEAYLNGSGVLCNQSDENMTSGICYQDTSNHLVWIKIPHFSGVGPRIGVADNGNDSTNFTASNLQFYNGTGWESITTLSYGKSVDELRVNCTNTADQSVVANATFTMYNMPDNNYTVNASNATNNASEWFVYDMTNFTIGDSGGWFISATCILENTSDENINSTVVVPWGTLSLAINNASGIAQVQKEDMFTVNTTVTCSVGECQNVNVFLDPIPSERITATNMQTVTEQLQESEKTLVIVKLKDSSEGKDMGVQQASFRASTQTSKNLDIRKEYKNFNLVTVAVDQAGLQELLANDMVEAIQPNERVRAFLDTAVPIVGSDNLQAHQIRGVNVTGDGVSVCVIDTGINYSHADFGGYEYIPNARINATQCFVDDLNLTDSVGWCPNGLPNGTDVMDDEGHGSHVAGIIASENETYKGAAPDAKLVIVKALDSSGTGWNADIISGIDWCVEHKDDYNIQIISMSLGGGGYSSVSACEAANPAYTTAIDAAVAQDITVLISSGNCQAGGGECGGTYYNQLASPSCVGSAIPIGATNDNDVMKSYAQAGPLLELVAPGDIWATDYTGSHTFKTGTSMAAPLAAGLAAQLIQYERLTHNEEMTPEDVRRVFLRNGEEIDDSNNSGYTYTRIGITDGDNISGLKGLVSTTIGDTPFYTTDNNPQNDSTGAMLGSMEDGEQVNINWTVNATGNYGSWEFFTFANQQYNETQVESARFDVAIVDFTVPSITGLSPADETMTNDSAQTFAFTASDSFDENLTCRFYLNSSLNETKDVTTGVADNFTETLNDGSHSWYINCTDEFENSDQTATRTITIDTTAPVTTLVLNGTSGSNGWYTSNVTISFIVDEENLNRTTHNISGWQNYTTPFNLSTEGNNSIQYYSVDDAGNTEDIKTSSIAIDKTVPAYTEYNTTVTTLNSSDILNVWANWTENFPATMTLYINGVANDTVSSQTFNNFTWTAPANLAQTTVNLTIGLSDIAGNSNVTPIMAIAVTDGSGPTVELLSPDNNTFTNDNTINFTFNASDNLGTVHNCTLYINGVLNETSSSIISHEVSSFSEKTINTGTYNWSVNCADGSNNIASSEVYFFEIDNTYPQHFSPGESPADPATYASSATYTFNITFNDSSSLGDVWLVFDGATYPATNIIAEVFEANVTDLAVGTYNYTWYGNDSAGNENNTGTLTYTVNKATTTCDLTFVPVGSVQYNGTVTANCTCDNSETSEVLYRDGSDVTSTENLIATVLGAGTYNYSCQASASQNYTVGLNESSFSVTQAIPTLSLSATSWTVDYGTYTNVTCSASSSEVTPVLYRDDVAVGGSSNVALLEVGTYNYSCNTSSTQNFTSASNWSSFTVNKAADSVSLTLITTTDDNISVTYPTNVTVNASSTTGTHSIYRNGTLIGDGSAEIVAAGWWNFTVNTTGNANYTGTSATYFAQVNRSTPSLTLLLNGAAANASVNVDTNVTANGSMDISQGTVTLEINGTTYGTGVGPLVNTTSFSTEGTYNATLSYGESENYSATSLFRYILVGDNVAPSVTPTSPTNDTWSTSNEVRFSYNASDAHSNVAYCSLYLDGLERVVDSTVVEGNDNVTVNVSSATHTWYITCVDNSSSFNNATSSTYTVKIDSQDPVTTVTGIYDGLLTSDALTITINGDDSGDSGLNYTSYKIDSGNWTNYTTAFTYNTTGMHTLYYYSVDIAGNVETTKNMTFTIDRTAPTVSFTSPSNGANLSAGIINVNLTTSGASYVVLKINGSQLDTVNQSAANYSFTLDTSLYSDGGFVLQAHAYDSAGNSNSTTRAIVIDKTRPTSTITSPSTTTYTNTPINVSGTVTDATSGAATIEVYNGTGWSAVPTAGGVWNTTSSFLTQGTYLIKSRATDYAGNVELVSESKQVTYDTTAPSISDVTSNPSPSLNASNITVQVKASDIYGISAVNATLNTTAVDLDLTGTNTYSATIPTPAVDGLYNLSVTVVDNAGNVATSSNYQHEVNTTEPIISVSEVNNSFLANGTNIVITVTNSVYSYYNTSSNNTPVEISGNENFFISEPDGSFNVFVWANSTTPGINVSKTIEYTVDSSNPIITQAALSSITTTDWVNVSGNVTEDNVLSLTINGEAITLSGNDYWYNATLAEGNNSFNTTVIDEAGNSDEVLAYTFLDTITPTTSYSLSDTSGNNGWYTSAVNVSFSVADGDESSGTYSQYWNGSEWRNASSVIVNQTGTVTFRSIDNAANTESNKTTAQIKIDSVAPMTTTPALSTTILKVNESATIRTNITDTGSGLATTQNISIADTTYNLVKESANTYKYIYTPTQPGSYLLTVYGYDKAGNVNSTAMINISAAVQETEYDFVFINETTNTRSYSNSLDTDIEVDMNQSATGNLTISLFASLPDFISEELEYASKYITYEVSDNVQSNLDWVIIKIQYDGTEIRGLQENRLALFWYNESSDSWVELTTDLDFVLEEGVNTSGDYVWAKVTHFSTYSFTGDVVNCTDAVDDDNEIDEYCYDGDTLRAPGSGYMCDDTFSDDECEVNETDDETTDSSSPGLGDTPTALETTPGTTETPVDDDDDQTRENATISVTENAQNATQGQQADDGESSGTNIVSAADDTGEKKGGFMSNYWLWILIIILVVCGLLAAYLFYFKERWKKKEDDI